MKCPTFLLNPHHFRSLLRSCARDASLSTGKKLHAIILTTGLSSSLNTFLPNVLLHMYAQCGITSTALHLFTQIPHSRKDTADWTALLSCLSKHDPSPKPAFSFFKQMCSERVVLDDVALVCVLSLCARVRDLEMGRQLNSVAVKLGLGFSVKICNALMNMYVKCGLIGECRRVFRDMGEKNVVSWSVLLEGVVGLEGVEVGRGVFDEMPERNEVAWTIMISGYVGSGFCKEGFFLLSRMVFGLRLGLNFVTLCSILSACTQSGDVMFGRWVHVYVLKVMGKDIDVMVGTALVDMYAKCGRINVACQVFNHLPRRNVVAWNAILAGLAMHGKGKLVLDMFPKMIREAKPDDLTFMAVLSACSHSGLVDQGWNFFNNLEYEYGVTPKLEHYACMVDLLGRAGQLEEAGDLIKKMPMPPNEVVLGSLLGSCSVHRKLELGERILQDLVQIDPHNTEYHILLSNMYALAGNQDKANSFRQVLKHKGIKKVPGMSSIYAEGKVHMFSSGDLSHPRAGEIYLMLDDMIRRLRSAGYVPNTSGQVLWGDTVEMEEKERALFSHSEKLALCFGLISTRPESALYIFKNLRICRDCHTAIKIASDVYNREIVVRDRNRFHCFKKGSCSCSDFW
ncbi:Pentatricopeptide repeat (PPR) superfamily protein [Euphorbia peplus]|nr:Pentatricopeptide repeat (PPR) superfamily protein [Euphorbia peplus]